MKRMLRMGLLGLLAMGLLASCGKDEKPYVPLEPELQEDYTEDAFGVNMKMVYVKGGEFKMGATAEQEDYALDDEKPVRTIRLDSYHIGKYEVTQGQWIAVMGTTLEERYDFYDSVFDLGTVGRGNDYPVYYVTWQEAQEFCRKLSMQTGKKYVLPTEAMWEYAARGGVHHSKTKYSGSNDIDEVAWYGESSNLWEHDPEFGTHCVGTKKANALGIYDMSGNVEELCSDWYSLRYDPSDSRNPQGASSGYIRVVRGGDWMGDARYCRISRRGVADPETIDARRGFRVAVLL